MSKMNRELLQCAYCAKNFMDVPSKKRRFCGWACKVLSSKKTHCKYGHEITEKNGRRRCLGCKKESVKTKSVIRRKCEHCKNLFTIHYQQQVNQKPRKFCSHTCSTLHYLAKKTRKKCLGCGNGFYGSPRHKFCSRNCGARAGKRRRYLQRKRRKETKVCFGCGKDFIPKLTTSNFCSYSCVGSQPRWRAPATQCKRGHEYTPKNTKFYPDGRRDCRECARANERVWKREHPNKVKDNARRYKQRSKTPCPGCGQPHNRYSAFCVHCRAIAYLLVGDREAKRQDLLLRMNDVRAINNNRQLLRSYKWQKQLRINWKQLRKLNRMSMAERTQYINSPIFKSILSKGKLKLPRDFGTLSASAA